MSTTVVPRVEYDDRFRQRPELVKAAEEAMAYLDGRFRASPRVPPPDVIRWGLRPLDPSAVELTMADHADGLQAVGIIPIHSMTTTDAYAREILTGRVWSDLLGERWQLIRDQINGQLAAFHAEPETEAADPLEPQTVP